MLLGLAAVSPAMTAADEREPLFWQNKVLEAELGLAKSNAVYFVIDQAKQVIVFKAKGSVLREWAIESFRCRPQVWPIIETTVLQKKALTVPQRKLIDPKKAEEIGSYEPDALEAKDMPADFLVILKDGAVIHISSKKEGLLSFMKMWEISFQLAAYEAAKDFWTAVFKPKALSLRLRTENPAEARMLCWSLSNGMNGLILLKKE